MPLLPWALAGAWLVAAGSAWLAPLAWLGGALWAPPLVRMTGRRVCAVMQ